MPCGSVMFSGFQAYVLSPTVKVVNGPAGDCSGGQTNVNEFAALVAGIGSVRMYE